MGDSVANGGQAMELEDYLSEESVSGNEEDPPLFGFLPEMGSFGLYLW